MAESRIEEFLEAINSGIEPWIKQLLDADPALANMRSKRGRTPLHWTSLTGQVGLMELLIAKGAKVNAEDANGFTPLQLAASVGNAEVIRILLRNGADVLAGRDHGKARLPVVETQGNSAVRVLVATMMKHRDMLKRLVQTTEPDTPERTLILETIVPRYSDPEQTAFALALTEARQAGVFETLSPLITSVKEVRWKLYDLSIEWKRSNPPLGAWNNAYWEFNKAIDVLIDRVPAVENAAKKEAPRRKKTQDIVRFPSPPDLRWKDVTIEFVSDQSVRVTALDKSRRYTFAEIGFKDGRRGDMPDGRWAYLRLFAKMHGEIPPSTDLGAKIWRGVPKAVQDIRQRLQVFMGINEDPFMPYHDVSGYMTRFVIQEAGDA